MDTPKLRLPSLGILNEFSEGGHAFVPFTKDVNKSRSTETSDPGEVTRGHKPKLQPLTSPWMRSEGGSGSTPTTPRKERYVEHLRTYSTPASLQKGVVSIVRAKSLDPSPSKGHYHRGNVSQYARTKSLDPNCVSDVGVSVQVSNKYSRTLSLDPCTLGHNLPPYARTESPIPNVTNGNNDHGTFKNSRAMSLDPCTLSLQVPQFARTVSLDTSVTDSHGNHKYSRTSSFDPSTYGLDVSKYARTGSMDKRVNESPYLHGNHMYPRTLSLNDQSTRDVSSAWTGSHDQSVTDGHYSRGNNIAYRTLSLDPSSLDGQTSHRNSPYSRTFSLDPHTSHRNSPYSQTLLIDRSVADVISDAGISLDYSPHSVSSKSLLEFAHYCVLKYKSSLAPR